MLKQEGKNRVSLGLRCEDCIHFKRVAKFETVCALQGINPKSSAPDCFSADVYKLMDNDHPELISQIGALVKHMGQSRLRILAYTFKAAAAIARQGFQFGQPVYFSLCEDYLTHYFQGYVIGATADGIYVASRIAKSKKNTMAMFLPNSVLTRSQFQKKAIELQIAGRIFMPKLKHNKEKCFPSPEYMDAYGNLPDFKSEKFDWEPPTLDTAPPEWLDAQDKKVEKGRKKKKGSKQRQKLIKMVEADKKSAKTKKKASAIVLE